MKLRTLLFMQVAAVIVVLVPVDGMVRGSTDDEVRFRRWGVGWDNGLAGRYMITRSLGLGVRFDSRFWYGIGASDDWDHDNAIRIDGMMFHQSPLGQHLFLGPFVELQWSIGRAGFKGALDRFGMAIGLRPALIVKERLVLESRFGLELSHLHKVGLFGGEEGDEGKTYFRYWSDNWELKSNDDNLPLKYRLRLIFMF